MIATAAFIETLPAWVWVYQGHAHPAIRFFYRVPRETLYALLNGSQGIVGNSDQHYYDVAHNAGIVPARIVYFTAGELTTHVAIV